MKTKLCVAILACTLSACTHRFNASWATDQPDWNKPLLPWTKKTRINNSLENLMSAPELDPLQALCPQNYPQQKRNEVYDYEVDSPSNESNIPFSDTDIGL